jgi:hypothetical protein
VTQWPPPLWTRTCRYSWRRPILITYRPRWSKLTQMLAESQHMQILFPFNGGGSNTFLMPGQKGWLCTTFRKHLGRGAQIQIMWLLNGVMLSYVSQQAIKNMTSNNSVCNVGFQLGRIKIISWVGIRHVGVMARTVIYACYMQPGQDLNRIHFNYWTHFS